MVCLNKVGLMWIPDLPVGQTFDMPDPPDSIASPERPPAVLAGITRHPESHNHNSRITENVQNLQEMCALIPLK